VRRIRSISLDDRHLPLALGVLAVLAYGLLLPGLGFFWDDWPNAWFRHAFGPGIFPRAFASDRPVLGYLYVLTTSVVGAEPLAWHVFALACRVLASLALASTIRLAWPSLRRAATYAALLFLVYPSFQQQYVSIIYSHFFLLFAAHFASLSLMLLALRQARRRPLLLAASFVMQAIALFSFEYSIGLEALRPILLWAAWRRMAPPTARRRFLAVWSPYVVITAAYLFWRLGVLGFPTYQPRLLDVLAVDAGNAFPRLGTQVLEDLGEVLVLAWAKAADLPDPQSFGLRASVFVLVVGSAVFLLSATFLTLKEGAEKGPQPHASATRGIIAAGLSLMLAGGVAPWVTQLPIGLAYPWDRLTLPLAIGASMILAGLAGALTKPAWLGPLAVSALLGVAVFQQVEIGFTFRRDWEAQRDFFWQLAWRAPAIRPGTVVLTNDIPFTYESDNSLTAPLNWLYADDPSPATMPYLLYFVSVRQGRGLPALSPGLPIDQDYRPTSFHGNTSQSLALFSRPPGCVQVLDEVFHDSMPTLPRDLSRAVPLASLEWIATEAPMRLDRLAELFGEQPRRDWCYTFEKADAARQRGDWETVAALGEAGIRTGDEPNAASEWLPFIEASARLGDLDRALELSRGAFDQNEDVVRMLCRTWRRLLPAMPDSERQTVVSYLAEIRCEP